MDAPGNKAISIRKKDGKYVPGPAPEKADSMIVSSLVIGGSMILSSAVKGILGAMKKM